MKKITLYLCLLLTALTLASCRSAKNATSNLAKEEITAAKNRFEAVTARNFDYDLLQSKVKYALGGKSLSGRLNIEHGKRLCLTVTVMGIEVARIDALQMSYTFTSRSSSQLNEDAAMSIGYSTATILTVFGVISKGARNTSA